MKQWQKYLNIEASQQRSFLVWFFGLVFGGQLIWAFVLAWGYNRHSNWYQDEILTAVSFTIMRQAQGDLWWIGAIFILFMMSAWNWLKEWRHDGAHLKRLLMLPGSRHEIAWAKFIWMLLIAMSCLCIQLLFFYGMNLWGGQLVSGIPFETLTPYSLLITIQSPIMPLVNLHPIQYLTTLFHISGIILVGLNTGILLGGPLLAVKQKIVACIYVVASFILWVLAISFITSTPLTIQEYSWIGFGLFAGLCLIQGILYQSLVKTCLAI